MAKFLAILLTLFVAAAITLSITSQPAVGVVSGICRDSKTGEPIDGATVELDAATDRSDNESNSSVDESQVVPAGMTQGTQGDAALDLAGHDRSLRTEWIATSDDDGHYMFKNVYVGSYTISASSSGHAAGDVPIAVAEGVDNQINVSMKRSEMSLSFNMPGRTWTTSDTPTVGLNGLLLHSVVQFELDKLNIDDAFHADPTMLTANRGYDTWKMRHTLVRKWTDEIDDADDEGSFFDQIQCGSDAEPRLPAGMYRLSAVYPYKRTVADTVLFAVTNIALLTKYVGDTVLVQSVDVQSGVKMPNVRCWCFDTSTTPDKVLSTGDTSQDGLCRLSSRGASSEGSGFVLARQGNSVAGSNLNLNSPGSADEAGGGQTALQPDERQLRAYIYTDRTVYKPGQLVNIKGITRWYQPGAGFIIPANAAVDVTITDPQGANVNHQKLTTNSLGTWSTFMTLSTEAQTGGYTITETVGTQSQSGSFAVAAYVKPECQVTVSFDKSRYVRGDKIVATITGAYFFGAPMSGATAEVMAVRSSEPVGDDSDNSNSGEPIDSHNFTLDGNGQAKMVIDTADQDPVAMQMTYTVSANVSDSSRSSAETQSSVVAAQGDFSIALTSSSTIADIGDVVGVAAAVTDDNGAPVAGKALHATAAYDVWQNNNDIITKFGADDVTSGSDGVARFTFKVGKAGLIDVDFSGLDSAGNKVTAETQIWVPGRDSDIPAQYSNIAVVLDKPKYSPGDTARLLITTAHPGPDALVTVEGSSLYLAKVVRLVRRATEIDLPVTEDDAPGVTVEAGCIVDKQYLTSSATLTIDDTSRKLRITVSTNQAKYHPEDDAAITVSTADEFGRPISADLSLAVVDKALFSIMPESSSTIEDAFLPVQTDNVQTAYSCQSVYYGDVDKGSTNIDIRRKFPDTALWIPHLQTNRQGVATTNLQLPDTLTTWRATAYGETAATQVGKGATEFVVNKDLSVRLETPPFLVAGDRSTLIAMIHDDLDRPMQVHLRLQPAGLVVAGDLSADILVAPGAPSRVSWPISAASAGLYSPKVTVQSGLLNDGVQEDVPVLIHSAKKVTWLSGTLIFGQSNLIMVDRNADISSSVLTVRLSPTLSSSLRPAADYLSTYPYGTGEAAVDALIVDSILDGSAQALNLSAATCADLKQKAERALLRTCRLQQNDGGWGWFDTDQSDISTTAHGVWALALAEHSGLQVNPATAKAAILEAGILSNIRRHSKSRSNADDPNIALAALALAESGSPKSAKENVDYLVHRWTIDPASSRTSSAATAALACEAIGDSASKEEAERLMASLWAQARDTGAMVSWTDDYHSTEVYAGEAAADITATAWSLLAAMTITPDDSRVDKAARWLASNRNDGYWCDPDTTAVVVLALAKYVAATHEMNPSFSAAVVVNGTKVGVEQFNPGSVDDPDIVVTAPGDLLVHGPNIVTLSKSGSGRLYYSIQLTQALHVPPQLPPSGFIATELDHLLHPPQDEPMPASGFRIRRIYMRLTSRRNFLWEDTVPTPDWRFNNGDSVLVRLIIDSGRPASDVVVDDPVPAGFRIAETSSDYDEDWSNESNWWDYTDVRSSDIVFFASNLPSGRSEIDYHLIANRAGSYDVMPTELGSIEDPALQVTGDAAKAEVDGQ